MELFKNLPDNINICNLTNSLFLPSAFLVKKFAGTKNYLPVGY